MSADERAAYKHMKYEEKQSEEAQQEFKKDSNSGYRPMSDNHAWNVFMSGLTL